MNVEVPLRAVAAFAECPTWDPVDRTLLWVDMNRSEVHRLCPRDGTDTVLRFEQPVAAAKPRVGGGLVLSMRDGVALRDPDGSLRPLADWSAEGVRGNDAGVDGLGRLWVGTMAGPSAPGWLGRVDTRGVTHRAVSDTRLSNGIAWSPDGRRMYFVDTPTRRIDVLDYDLSTGEASGRRPFVEPTDTAGVPDGLCVDADGGVWVALFRGGAVRRYTPRGTLDREIPFPVALTTSCGFGGEDLTDLYVTTARRAPEHDEPLAGSVFVVPGAGQGLTPTAFAG
ncbi:SMP-30/gluconolactonase/LRE family protein (plasmid) [Streptomyces sp. NBC_01426]|uniref:SMP-30/gluconolactonase/LRE family protein n=1 Tax=Streptomyces sp. NBC_01426 TaxID=2975866 RepID=UPI002E31922B|nr:SMP-30/gluconolactonase/LRE family protein [Streptomyces sp. NBC_01426]